MEQIRLDLIPGKSAPVCHASQYDVGRTIRLNLVEGGSEYSIPAGTTAEIHIRKPDNNIISAAVTATQGNKYIDIVTAEQWTACAGTNLCEIVLTNGGNVIGTINFILEVEMDPIDGGSASESVIYNIQALVDTAVALHTFLIHITETTMTESAADILDAINSNKILQVIYKPDANNLATHILPLTLDSGARPDGIRALAFAGFWGSKLYAADIVLDSIHSTVASLSMTNGKDLDETGDFPIHIHNSTITETAGEVLDAMADGLKPYVIWTNNSQSNYTFTYVLSAVWNPDATTETLIFGCSITGAVRTIHVFINPTTRTYSSSISIVDYNIPQINDSSTSSSAVWSSQKTASELAGKAEIDDTTVSSSTAWSSEQIVSLLPTESASGAVASFETPLTLPVVSHSVTIEPVQAGTGDPSPSNPRAISGWSAFNLKHAPFYHRLISSNPTTQELNGLTFITQPNGLIKVSGTASAQTTFEFSFDDFMIYSGEDRLVKFNNTFINANIQFYNYSTRIDIWGLDVVNKQNNTYVGMAGKTINKMSVTFISGATYEGSMMIEFFKATNEDATYTRAFLDSNDNPIIVYGGSDNLKTGEGKSNCAFVEFDGSQDEPWVISSNGTFFYLDGIAYKHDETQSAVMCSIFQPLPNGNSSSFTGDNQCLFLLSTSNDRLYVKHTESTDVSDFRTFLSNNPMRLVYILATPQTFHCDPLTLNTLKGVNNIWADTGDTLVEFKQDIQTYIDSRLSSGTRSLSLAKAPVEEKEETKQEEQEGDESLTR